MIRLLNLYPPYIGAGVRVKTSPDLRTFEVRMRLRWWNRNVEGTHFGGSLYSMCDPFFMMILIEALGGGYVVWDKSATIRFRRPRRRGRGRQGGAGLSGERRERAGRDRRRGGEARLRSPQGRAGVTSPLLVNPEPRR
jgi:Domain of unknown function (DUF4442)